MNKKRIPYEDMISVFLNYTMRLDYVKKRGIETLKISGGSDSEYLKVLRSVDIITDIVKNGLNMNPPEHQHIVKGINDSDVEDREKIYLIIKHAMIELKMLVIEFVLYSIKNREDWENIHPERQQYIYSKLKEATNLLPEDVFNP